MKYANLIDQKILTRPQLIQRVAQWRLLGKTIAFTNGVFDILHPGHIYSLSQAASEPEMLVVGLNADVSVKRLKGESRPVNVQDTRAIMMASLQIVDAVVLFEEDTPLELIKSILPDVLVKGGDYTLEQVFYELRVVERFFAFLFLPEYLLREVHKMAEIMNATTGY